MQPTKAIDVPLSQRNRRYFALLRNGVTGAV